MSERLVLLLPAVTDPADAAAHWWRVSETAVLESGSDARWRDFAAPATGGPGLPLVALAPVAAVRLAYPEASGETERQRLGVARALALGASMAEADTLHSAAASIEDRVTVAIVANGAMIEWLDWLKAFGADPDAILPASLLLPPGDDWLLAALGSERMIGRDRLVLADEPALREALVGEAEPVALEPDEIAARLASLAATRPLNLRTGRFARRRLFVLDWRRVRELAALTLVIPLLGAIMALIMIVRLNSASDRLDAETSRLAAEVLGSEVAAEAAASALDARIGQVPGASGSPFVPLAAVYQQLQQVPGVTASALSWRPDGTLAVSLAATRAEEINRILLALQRAGYRVTATSRAGPSGQMIADITVRSAS